MNQLCNEFGKIFPNYAPQPMNGKYLCEEQEHPGNPNTFRHFTLNQVEGYSIPNTLVKDDSSIFVKAGTKDLLREDCDGIFLTEQEGKKYLYLCELKSTFSTQQITKAKNQLIGSYLKLHSLFSLLQAYHPEEWIVKGIIVSFAPDTETVNLLSKNREQNKAYDFCFCLHRDKKYTMPAANCQQFFAPLNLPELTLHYLAVPGEQKEFSVNFRDLMAV
ncbi:MAG: hypothetical protein KHX53_00685 [Bacteroides sp.]|nr:hypothetical protein [Bacteroides sp.]